MQTSNIWTCRLLVFVLVSKQRAKVLPILYFRAYSGHTTSLLTFLSLLTPPHKLTARTKKCNNINRYTCFDPMIPSAKYPHTYIHHFSHLWKDFIALATKGGITYKDFNRLPKSDKGNKINAGLRQQNQTKGFRKNSLSDFRDKRTIALAKPLRFHLVQSRPRLI